MKTNSNKTLKERLDSLINIYLFDLEYDLEHDTAPEEDEVPLWQKERDIYTFASRLPKQDLQEIYQKYQKQNKELLSEIEWRKNNQKSSNPVREKLQKSLYNILLEFESLIEGNTENLARERQREKIHSEQRISKPSLEKKSLVNVAIESGTNIFSEPSIKKEPPIEETISKIPDTISETLLETKSEPKQKTKSFSTKKKKAKEKEEIVFEEALSSDDPILKTIDKEVASLEKEPRTPEERIEKMISQYLIKRPKIDWKERDKQEELLRKKLYQKEWEKKEERQKEEGKKAKTTTLKLWGKEEIKKKKSWWPF